MQNNNKHEGQQTINNNNPQLQQKTYTYEDLSVHNRLDKNLNPWPTTSGYFTE